MFKRMVAALKAFGLFVLLMLAVAFFLYLLNKKIDHDNDYDLFLMYNECKFIPTAERTDNRIYECAIGKLSRADVDNAVDKGQWPIKKDK